MFAPITKSDFTDWFSGELSLEENLIVECPFDFQYNIDHKNEKVTPISSNSRLKSLLEKSGLLELEIGFSPLLEQGWEKGRVSDFSKIETFNAYGN